MSGIRDILTRKNATIVTSAGTFSATRPSCLDLIEAIEVSEKSPRQLHAWFVFRHLVDGNNQVFLSVDDVMQCDVHLVAELGKAIEGLYGEGRD